jgi:hypothetical protein
VRAALQADELGDVVDVLREHVLPAPRHDRHGANAERQELVPAGGVLDDVYRDEVNAFARKKLFRPEAGASPGLGEEDVFVVGHGEERRL